jgi:hypothetical protein
VLVNQTTPNQTVTISNAGQGPAIIQRIDLQQPAIFTVLNDTCTGKTVAPNASCTLDVSFDPATGGPAQGGLVVTYSGSSAPLTVPFTGEGYYLSMTLPTLQASWTSPLIEEDKSHLLTTTGIACASYTRVAYAFTLNDSNPNGQHNALDTAPNGVPLSQSIPASGVEYDNMDLTLIWKAQAYIQFVGVGTGQVQVKYTVQITGSGSTFQILTPMAMPPVAQVAQCPGGIQPFGR